MKKMLLCLALLVTQTFALAGAFTSFKLSDDQATLVITSADGAKIQAPQYADQVGFNQPRISADGNYVGWLAMYANCCTSYAIPLRLIVLDEFRQLHSFDGNRTAMFSWCFLPKPGQVAFTQTVVHGSDFQYFERRTIRSNKLLAQYKYPDDDGERAVARKRAPAWVRCVPEMFLPNAEGDGG